MKKKNTVILIFCCLAIVCSIAIFYFGSFSIEEYSYLMEHQNTPQNAKALTKMTIYLITRFLGGTLLLLCAIYESINAIKELRGFPPSYNIRYTYEEYKAYRAKRKEEKQAKKRAKLQEKIDKMEKTE